MSAPGPDLKRGETPGLLVTGGDTSHATGKSPVPGTRLWPPAPGDANQIERREQVGGMERGRVRMAPYVRRAVPMRYTAASPPPLDPPAELAGAVNPGVWRVAAQWWRDHQPDEGGRVCRACFRLYPCPGVLGADGILDTIWRRATARGRAAVVALHPRNRRV